MAASFPGSIKTFTTKVDDVDDILAAHVNDLQDEVTEIETELQALASNPRKLVFFEASAPTRWTIDATNNDAVLRIVSATGGGTGGSDSISSPPSHTHSGASHTHTFTTAGSTATIQIQSGSGAFPAADGHTHTGTTDSGGGGTTGATVGFSPKFINVIICTKDA